MTKFIKSLLKKSLLFKFSKTNVSSLVKSAVFFDKSGQQMINRDKDMTSDGRPHVEVSTQEIGQQMIKTSQDTIGLE